MKNFIREIREQESSGPYNLSALVLADIGQGVGVHCIRTLPQGEQPPHYHRAGADLFIILSGTGQLYRAQYDEKANKCFNQSMAIVSAGDYYEIPPLEVHWLRNSGKDDLVYINVAPYEHAQTDVFIVPWE